MVESLKANKNQLKRSHISQYSFAQKNLTHFTNVNSLNIKYTPATQPKTLPSLQIFQQTCLWLVSETVFPKHFESKCVYIPVNLRNKIFVQRRRKVLSGGGMNNFLNPTRCFSLVKRFKMLHLTKNFLKFNYFPALRYFNQQH